MFFEKAVSYFIDFELVAAQGHPHVVVDGTGGKKQRPDAWSAAVCPRRYGLHCPETSAPRDAITRSEACGCCNSLCRGSHHLVTQAYFGANKRFAH